MRGFFRPRSPVKNQQWHLFRPGTGQKAIIPQNVSHEDELFGNAQVTPIAAKTALPNLCPGP
jgi:hypothetical protein